MLIQVADKDEKLTLLLDQIYFWKDERINFTNEHPFWSGNKSNVIKLNGDFVENCLWTPKLDFKHLTKISAVKPTPSSSNGSPFKVLLHKLGIVQVELRNFQITVPCNMEFADYPFDQQVTNSIPGEYLHFISSLSLFL